MIRILEKDNSSNIAVQIENEVKKAVYTIMTSKDFGFSDSEADKYAFVEAQVKGDSIVRVEVRAEVSYDGLWTLKKQCDKVVKKYDNKSYFDMVTSGIMEAYVEL